MTPFGLQKAPSSIEALHFLYYKEIQYKLTWKNVGLIGNMSAEETFQTVSI